MNDERYDPRSARFQFPPLMLRTRTEALAELSRECERFKSLFSSEEALRSFIVGRIGTIDVVPGQPLIAETGVPLNWQHMLHYLYTEGVIAAPRFGSRSFANDRPKVFSFQLELNRSGQPTQARGGDAYGFGGAFSREVAMSKAIGETLERYFLSTYTRDGMVHKTPNELFTSGKRILDIERLNGFLPWQKKLFPQFAYEKDSAFYWMKCEELSSGRTILVPAQLVFWNYAHKSANDDPQEKILGQYTTSGCAGHFSREEAILAGLLENVQRDGFLIHWLNGLSPKVIDVSESTDPEIIALLKYLARYQLDATFLNTTTDVGIPSAVCVVTDTATGEPVISVGGGAGFDQKSVIIQSAIEAIIVNNFVAEKEAFDIPEDYRPFSDRNLGRIQRLTAWKGKKMAERFAFFTSGEKQSLKDFMGKAEDLQDPHEQLTYICDRFRDMGEGYEVYVYEVNDPVLKTLGYHVVRTIVPQLIPLYLSEHAAPLDSKRLREVPAKLGLKAAARPTPWPHPFP
jgi:ribosomal protein S12 methylthiotransferase accessory factor